MLGLSQHTNFKTMADIINKHLEPNIQKEYSPELTMRKKQKDYGYEYYSELTKKQEC